MTALGWVLLPAAGVPCWVIARALLADRVSPWAPAPVRYPARHRFADANPYAVQRDGWRQRPGVAALSAMWPAEVVDELAPVVVIGRPPVQQLVRAA